MLQQYSVSTGRVFVCWKWRVRRKMSKAVLTVGDVHVASDHDVSHVGTGYGSDHQVILYNDNVNTVEYVVSCLIKIFGHPQGLAEKIMMEAHKTGRTIAQVESREKAMQHKQQLEAAGLTADVEKI